MRFTGTGRRSTATRAGHICSVSWPCADRACWRPTSSNSGSSTPRSHRCLPARRLAPAGPWGLREPRGFSRRLRRALTSSAPISGGPISADCHRPAGVTGPASVGERITLLARTGCHLCDDARAVIERVAADLDVGWEERDITERPDDLREYWDKIPVTFVDGVQIDFWRVSEARLRAALG